ncbi:hypothetical protein AHF37_12169 [Paragonimus kellicotti]|nr:hypothetical protein AHF37_12169 [Paragonimus kellicotti]
MSSNFFKTVQTLLFMKACSHVKFNLLSITPKADFNATVKGARELDVREPQAQPPERTNVDGNFSRPSEFKQASDWLGGVPNGDS